jgi:hypothetical protein
MTRPYDIGKMPASLIEKDTVWGPAWRKSIGKRAAALGVGLGSSTNGLASIFVWQNGCPRCPYRGKVHDPEKGKYGCPYGIGIKVWSKDSYSCTGRLSHKKGDVVNAHTNGICPERVMELKEHLNLCSSLNGLRQKRSHSLWEMENKLTVLMDKLHSFIEKDDGVLVRDIESGDTKLATLIDQIDRIHQRYHNKLDAAISQEGHYKQMSEKKLAADDINEQLKRVNVIDIKIGEDDRGGYLDKSKGNEGSGDDKGVEDGPSESTEDGDKKDDSNR